MRRSTWILVIGLFLATAASIIYKTFYLGVSFIPTVEKNLWNVELSLKLKPSARSRTIGFPVPRPSDRLTIKSTQFDGKGMSLTIEKRPDVLRGQWQGKVPAAKTVFYRVILELREKQYTVRSFLPPEPRTRGCASTSRRPSFHRRSRRRSKAWRMISSRTRSAA